jgi:hypothetical protein
MVGWPRFSSPGPQAGSVPGNTNHSRPRRSMPEETLSPAQLRFFGVKFSISTNKIDPQTKTACAPPIVELKDGKLTADLSSWAASWNKQNFNQGAPKPVLNTGAKSPGQQQAQQAWNFVSKRFLGSASKATVSGTSATGTFNPRTDRFDLQWTSLIVGGPFNGFTGLWHLEGVYRPAGRAAGP